MKLLIIDDEPHIRQMMRLTLEAAGYQVDEAADGQAGLDALRDGGEYDAVVLDQKMPGLDGLETLRAHQGAHAGCVRADGHGVRLDRARRRRDAARARPTSCASR